MKKGSSRVTVSKNAWNLAKNYANSNTTPNQLNVDDFGDVLTLAKQTSMEDSTLQKLEDEVMGEVTKINNNKSDVMERNLNQMIDVLHLRLKALETAAKVRMEYCVEDRNPNSTKESKMAPKIMEEFEDQRVNPRVLLKDMKASTTQVKDVNLVSMEGVIIDPYKLVIKTKPGTDAAKKLETKLEEKYSSSRLELKGKKNKTARQVARSKESQTKRYESKKTQRQKLEKELTANMESYVTRSVNDPDLDFIVPSGLGENDEVPWPISIKWMLREQKGQTHHSLATGLNQGNIASNIPNPTGTNHSTFGANTASNQSVGGQATITSNPENLEGEMCPELLLLYSLERINLPSGERIFKKLFRNIIFQKYFVYMFWFIKVLFFQSSGSSNNSQKQTISGPSSPPRSSNQQKALTSQNSLKYQPYTPRDTAERYLLSKLGSEYVKIVELLSKFTHGENNKDFIFKYLPYLFTNAIYYSFYFLCPGSRHLYSKGLRKTILLQIVQIMHGVQLCPISVKVTWNKLFPEDIQEDDDGEENEMIPLTVPVHGKKVSNNTTNEQNTTGGPSNTSGPGGSNPSSPNRNKDPKDRKHKLSISHSTGNIKPPQFSSFDEDENDEHQSLMSSQSLNFNTIRLNDELSRQSPDINHEDHDPRHVTDDPLQAFHVFIDPIDRVNLKPPIPKSRYIVPRQKREKCDINDISPLMQQYLELPTASGGKPAQNLLRTIPINWCVAGGSDTHRKRHIPKELHDELSLKVKNISKANKKTNSLEHQKKLKDTKLIDKNYQNIIKGGPSIVARYSQDLVRKLKHVRGLSECEANEEKSLPTLHNSGSNDEEEYSSELINSMLGMTI